MARLSSNTFRPALKAAWRRRLLVGVVNVLISIGVAAQEAAQAGGLHYSPARAPFSAQTTSGTLIGQVFGQSGSPLAGAKVTVVNENNGNPRAARTNADGSYTVSFLTPGSYTITASLAGYTDGSISGFIVPLNATTPLRPPRITLVPVSGGATRPPTGTNPPAGTNPPTGSNPPSGTNPPTGANPATGATGRASQPQSELSPMVNAQDATRRANFDQAQVVGLPLGGLSEIRTFDDLAFLAPGVAPPPYTPGVRGPGVGFGIGTAGEFSVNGARGRSNNFTVDGSDNNDPDVGVRRQGFVALIPQSIESIQEFEISTLLWDAEQGRNSGSQVNAVSRAGGTKYHGQAYGFFTDSRLNARNFFDYTGGQFGDKTPYTRSQAGFVFGGPMIRDRTQFFTSFEHQDINASTEQHFAVPTTEERDFRLFVGSIIGRSVPVLNIQSSPLSRLFGPVFSADSPPVGFSPLGGNVLSAYPLPNNPSGPYGANTFTEVLPSGGDGSIFSFRVTHRAAQNHVLNARYNFTDDSRLIPSIDRAINSSIGAATRTQDLSLILVSNLSPTRSNETRFSYGRTTLGFSELASSPLIFQRNSLPPINGVPTVSTTGPVGQLLVEPFSPVGVDTFTFPQSRVDNTFQYGDSVAWRWRDHLIKFGGDIRRVQLNSLMDRNYRPQLIYGDDLLFTGDLSVPGPNAPFRFTFDQQPFLLPGNELAAIGLPSSILQSVTTVGPDSRIGLRFTELNFLINDNWRVRRNLSLNYGLRYEHNTVPHEVNGIIENAIQLKELASPGNSVFDQPARTAAFNNAVSAYKQVLGGRSGIYDPDYKDFGPHFGFAWDPLSDGKTSIRGGYGIYYDTILGAVVSQSRNVFPLEIPINIDPSFGINNILFPTSPPLLSLLDAQGRPLTPLIVPGTTNKLEGSPQDFPALVGSLFLQNKAAGGLAFTLPSKHLPTPYEQQWHLSLERELLPDFLVTAAYVGTKGTHLTRLTTPNLGPTLLQGIPVATKGNAPVLPLVLANDLVRNFRRDRPIPDLGAFQIFENTGNSTYHSLQLESRKRFSGGYMFTAAYTWSHAIDDVSDIFPIAGAPILAEDQNNLRLDRGNASFDVRHRLAMSLIWELPFYRNGRRQQARWLGGWQLSSIFQYSTGQPFTLNLPLDANADGNLTDRPSTTNGLVFFDGHRRQRVAIAPGRALADFFVLGQDGFVGRNTVSGDSFIDWDVAASKDFHFTERHLLNVRAEFFNLMNRANFGLPIRVLGAPGFGSAVETATPNRVIQFALKYAF